jgi:serine phosphatase RsbU (regulator of sigma subunit)
MRPGERIVVFTDGVTEAEDRSGEFYGDARLESSVLSGASVEVVFRNVQLFMAGAASTDDCTLLEICYGPCS